MEELINYLFSKTFLETIALIAIMVVLLVIIKNYLIKRVAYKTYSKDDQKKSSFVGIIFNVLQYLVILLTVFFILKIHGVNVTGMLAGIGIVATIVGLSLQDTLKDVINGINIYNNNFYKVNDYVRYNNELCKVKYFNARVTKFQSLYTNSTFTVSNSNINAVEKVKDMSMVSVIFPFDEDHDKIMKALEEACFEVKRIDNIQDSFVAGCIDIATNGNKYLILVKADPLTYLCTCPKVYEIVIRKLKEYGLKPSNQQFIHVDNVN